MKLNPKEKPENLAEVIVRLPDGSDFSAGPVGALFRELCLGEGKEPGRYAKIMQLVMEHPNATPWMRYAAGIESFNGLRRETGANIGRLAEELDELLSEIDAKLPHSPDKFDLLGEAYYNLGIMEREPRHYERARRFQENSASWFIQADKPFKWLVSIFVASVEELTLAFVSNDRIRIPDLLESLRELRNSIQLKTGNLYPAWMQRNACLHIGWGAMMADLIGLSIELTPYENDFLEGANSQTPQWAAVFEAQQLYLAKSYDALTRLASPEHPSSSRDNAKLTLDIFAALAYRELGNSEVAEKILWGVAHHTGSDGGIPIAVAHQLLAA